jgi:hypothetical protein
MRLVSCHLGITTYGNDIAMSAVRIDTTEAQDE